MLKQYFQDDYMCKLENRLSKLEKNYNKECPICMEKIGKDGYTKLKCGHMLDVQCFVTMCKNNINKCPLCRDEIYDNDDSDSDEEIDTSVVERNVESLLTFDYQTLEQLHEDYNYAFDEISISALQTVMEEYMLGVDVDNDSYRLEPPNPTPPPPDHNLTEEPRHTNFTMEELYPVRTWSVFDNMGTIDIFQILERSIEGMNLESPTQFTSSSYLHTEYTVKYPNRLISVHKFEEVLDYLVATNILEQDEDGFYRKKP